MMRRKKSWWGICLFAVMWCLSAVGRVYGQTPAKPEASGGTRVYDMAGLLGEEERSELEAAIDGARKDWKLDLVIVTTEDAEGKTSTEYADDFYDAGGFGEGKDKDGILFLIDMDNRELTFSTSGIAIRIFTDARIEAMLDRVYEGASQGNYKSCADAFLSDVERYCQKGIAGGQYNYDTETGKISVYRSISGLEALLAVAVSSFVAWMACLGVKCQYAMAGDEREIASLNMAYRSTARFAYDNRIDNLVNQFVTTRTIASSTGSGSGSSGHSSSRRSSTHTSSSGRSHGGRSRRF